MSKSNIFFGVVIGVLLISNMFFYTIYSQSEKDKEASKYAEDCNITIDKLDKCNSTSGLQEIRIDHLLSMRGKCDTTMEKIEDETTTFFNKANKGGVSCEEIMASSAKIKDTLTNDGFIYLDKTTK